MNLGPVNGLKILQSPTKSIRSEWINTSEPTGWHWSRLRSLTYFLLLYLSINILEIIDYWEIIQSKCRVLWENIQSVNSIFNYALLINRWHGSFCRNSVATWKHDTDACKRVTVVDITNDLAGYCITSQKAFSDVICIVACPGCNRYRHNLPKMKLYFQIHVHVLASCIPWFLIMIESHWKPIPIDAITPHILKFLVFSKFKSLCSAGLP